MLNQSFRQVFVTNTPNLLASGTTVDLGVGQIGFFDGNSYAATASPTYAKNKALYIGQGRADVPDALMLGIAGNTELSKLIKGKRITGFRGHRASRGRTESMTVGYDGVDVTKTLAAKCGQVKTFYLKLSGQPITTMYSPQGVIQQYQIDAGPCADCVAGDENCENVCAEPLADKLVSAINSDKVVNKFVRAKKLLNCDPARAAVAGTVSNTRYQVSQSDAGDVSALGGVQSQYPGKHVSVVSRNGSVSTYEIVQPTAAAAPAALSNLNNVVIPDCPTCPAGYTSVAGGYVYVVRREDEGDNASAAITTDYSAATVSKVNSEFGTGTYVVTKATEITAASGNDSLSSRGYARQSCVLSSPTTTAWAAKDTLTQFPKKYTLTIKDECDTDRLADVQAAYPSLVVTLTPSTPSDSCAHRYETTVLSDPLASNCGIDEIKYNSPSAFEGIDWTPDESNAPDCTGCVAGVIIESAFVNRTTNDITYDHFSHDYDGVHLEGSYYQPDYNASPYHDAIWPVTHLQKIEYPHGDGHWVRKEEEKSKMYTLQYRSLDAGVREAEGYYLNTKLDKYYDEYTIEFSFSYKVLGWSETYTDSYHVVIYVPEGQGKQIENAVNSYLTSAAIDIDPVVL